MMSYTQAILSSLQAKIPILAHTIFGHMPSGKNNYRITGKRLFKHEKVNNYTRSFLNQALLYKSRHKPQHLDYKGPLALMANVFNQDMRRDVDTILFCDLLQKSGLIINDRQIRFKVINGIETDKQIPRVEFELYKLEDE